MRRPTGDPFKWWRAALASLPKTFDFSPQCGYFKRRFVRDGPWIPCRVWIQSETDPETGELISDEIMCCDVGMQPRDPDDEWPYLCAHPITEKEYIFLVKLMKYAKARAPREPLANPRKPIDLLTIPAPVFKAKRRRRP